MCSDCGKIITQSPSVDHSKTAKPVENPNDLNGNILRPSPLTKKKKKTMQPEPSNPQGTLFQLANAICMCSKAFAATKGADAVSPLEALKRFAPPGWMNISPITVWEDHPDTLDSSTLVDPIQKPTFNASNDERARAPYPVCGARLESYGPKGEQLIGFAATVPSDSVQRLEAKNILVLRGTVTNYESLLSFEGWNDRVAPNFSRQQAPGPPKNFGVIKAAYWDFFSKNINPDTRDQTRSTLEEAIQTAMNKTYMSNGAHGLPWFATGHSLGGALITLSAFNTVTYGFLPYIVTFGSVAVGDSVFAAKYNSTITEAGCTTLRVANLCDFIPPMRNLLTPNNVDYVQVGRDALFVWQQGSDWVNHSLNATYMAVMGDPSSFKNITLGTPDYPVGIQKLGFE